MKFAVVFNKDLAPQKQDSFIPLEWPMYLTAIKDDEKTAGGVQVISLEDLNVLKNKYQSDYEEMQAQKKDYFSTRKLRITDLIAFEYKDFNSSKIDFTLHLKSGLNLEKRDVYMTKNGRPIKIVYYFLDQKIAEVLCEFEVDALNFMTRKVRKLGYYSVDDLAHEHYIIEDLRFNGNISYQHQKRLEERTQARQYIIDSLRSDIDRILTVAVTQNPTASNYLSAMINAFWVEYNPHLSAFINAGGVYLKAKFASDTTYPFLNSLVARGVTVRMFVMDKLTY